jgi:Helicase HerA, central domain
MQDFEKLGAFYLGKNFHDAALSDDVTLLESKNLTTHAVIIGMTGSGKTGLGIGMLEEALIDNIPVIAIDPKGDLTNLLLSFPDLDALSFQPWVSADLAAQNNQSVEEFAASQAAVWKQGLADWGQDGERIQKMRAAVDFTVYTPGSNAGVPVNVLRSFDPPAAGDEDALRGAIQSTVSSLLGLLGIEADPIRSREHILLSSILANKWAAGEGLDLGALIALIQQPPFEKIGVMALDSFYPAKDRFELAMSLNALLASPGFQAWMQGEPLEVKNFLYTAQGKPRLSVFYIAHLSDAERMFFVSALLNATLGWMRQQSGTPSLRAILYMDEIFGYFPPNGNPPSKTPMLTLLKQARAFGLGLVLSTQNPVDLDYKGLANTGTWFIGRLQTDNDKNRVLEALSASAAGVSGSQLSAQISGLGKRVFLMHSVNQPQPITFQTRWTMSYLAGPMTLEQIKRLMSDKKTASVAAAAPTSRAAPQPASKAAASSRPVLPPDVKQYFIPPSRGERGHLYFPMILGSAEARVSSAKYRLDTAQTVQRLAEIGDGPVAVDWDNATELKLELNRLEQDAPGSAEFSELQNQLSGKALDKWGKEYAKWVTQTQGMTLFTSSARKLTSEPNESEQDFRIRLSQAAREARDEVAAKLQAKYAPKIAALEEKIRKAEQAVATQKAQAQQAQLSTAVNVGMGILGALLGGGRSSSINKAGSALNKAGRAYREGQDVTQAAENVSEYSAQLQELQTQLQTELETLQAVDVEEKLDEVQIKPKQTDVTLQVIALAWAPFERDDKGRLNPAWE